MMLAEGEGGPKDEMSARALFEKAAAQGHAGALAALLGNEDARAALKRVECDLVIRDKRGKQVGCF